MKTSEEAYNDLSEIRNIMQRSTSFLSLSGLSGISVGIIGVMTYAYLYWKTDNLLENQYDFVRSDDGKRYLTQLLFTTAIFSLLTAVLSAMYFSFRKAKKKNLPIWDSVTQRVAINLAIPLITGAFFCGVFYTNELFILIPPTMVVFYGLALVNVSKYTLGEIRYLGVCELIVGLLGCFFTEYSYWSWLVGFGFLNIIYGLIMYFKYDR